MSSRHSIFSARLHSRLRLFERRSFHSHTRCFLSRYIAFSSIYSLAYFTREWSCICNLSAISSILISILCQCRDCITPFCHEAITPNVSVLPASSECGVVVVVVVVVFVVVVTVCLLSLPLTFVRCCFINNDTPHHIR